MSKLMIRLACAAGMAAVLGACGGGGGDDPVEEAAPSSASAVIGPQGGTLDGPDGVQVVVPPGALTQPTTPLYAEAEWACDAAKNR